jgi:hypothetical protein
MGRTLYSEIGAAFSPTGRTLLFSRDLGGPRSGESFVAHLDGNEDWPRPCRPPLRRTECFLNAP